LSNYFDLLFYKLRRYNVFYLLTYLLTYLLAQSKRSNVDLAPKSIISTFFRVCRYFPALFSLDPVHNYWQQSLIRQLVAVDVIAKVEHVALSYNDIIRLCCAPVCTGRIVERRTERILMNGFSAPIELSVI